MNPYYGLAASAAGPEASQALGLYNDIQSGTPQGDIGAASQAAKLYGNVSGTPMASELGGALGAGLGIYGGIERGGAAGDIGAGLSAANLAGDVGSLAGGTAAGGLGSLATAGAFAGPLALALAPVLMGMTSPPWVKNGDYTNRMRGYLQAGPGQFAQQGGYNGSYWDPQYMDYMAARQDQSGTDWNSLVSSGIVPFAPGVTGGHPGTQNVSQKAKGGPMKSKSQLKKKYGVGGRIPRFDDGGGVDSMPTIDVNAQAPPDPSYQMPALDPSQLQSPVNDQQMQQMGDAQYNPNSSGFASPLLSALGMHGLANSSSAQQAGAIAALMGLLGHSNVPSQNFNPTPPQQFGGVQPQPGQNMWGNFGTTPRRLNPANANINYATYGQGPEQSFFLPGQTAQAAPPGAPTPPPVHPMPIRPGVIHRAEGGYQSPLHEAMVHNPSQHGAYVQGPGDGTSDDINAKLSDGEFVMDAATVSMLGNGSNKAGADKLEQLRQNLRKHAGKSLAKGKQFMKAKDPEVYAGVAGTVRR